MYQGQRVAVVIPAFHEAARIPAVVKGVPAFVDFVIVVDDGSGDGTAEAAQQTHDPRVECVVHERNRGVGAAIVTGYKRARAQGAELLVVMAGDGQMDPEDLPGLLDPLVRGEADYVKGNRLHHPEIPQMPWLRRAGTGLFGRLTGWAIGAPNLGDSQCGYTAMTGFLADQLPLDRIYSRYGYPNDMLSHVALRSGRIGEVPVRPIYAGEASGLRWRHGFVVLGLILRARVRRYQAER